MILCVIDSLSAEAKTKLMAGVYVYSVCQHDYACAYAIANKVLAAQEHEAVSRGTRRVILM